MCVPYPTPVPKFLRGSNRMLMKLAVLTALGSLAFVAVSIAPPSAASSSADSERITPVMLVVQDAPVAFTGSDGRTHLAYELWLKNFSSGKVALEKVEILGDGSVLRTLDSTEIAT